METPGQVAAALLPPIEESEGEFYSEDQIEEMDAETEPQEPVAEAETPAVEEPTPEEETPAEETVEPNAEAVALQQDAQAFRNLSKAMVDNPVGYVQYMLNQMTQAQRDSIGVTAPAPPKDPTADWGDFTDALPHEKFVKEHAQDIVTLKESAPLLKDLPRWAGEVGQTQAGLVQAAMSHENEIATLRATVEALSQAVGMKLPDAKTATDPKAFAAAVKKEAARIATTAKAEKTITPKSIRQGAGDGGAEPIEVDGKDFMQIFRQVKRAATR